MSLEIIRTPGTGDELNSALNQIEQNFLHLAALWDSVHPAKEQDQWSRSSWARLPDALKSLILKVVDAETSSDFVWPEYIYYSSKNNTSFESLIPFEIHSGKKIKDSVSNGSKDQSWIIYLDSTRRLQKTSAGPVLINGLGLNAGNLVWTYDGQDTGIFVSGPPSQTQQLSTHMYVARCITGPENLPISTIPSGIENQTDLDLSARGGYVPSTRATSNNKKQIELIGLTETGQIESGSPVLVLSQDSGSLWLSTIQKEGSVLYAYCGESNHISAHHTSAGLTQLVSTSTQQEPLSLLEFNNKQLRIYSDNNILVIDLAQTTLNIEYPVIITRNRDQYDVRMIDINQPLLRVDASINAQRGLILRGSDNGTAWGQCISPIDISEAVLTLETVSTLRNTAISGRDWVMNYSRRVGQWSDGYYPFITDEYPQIQNNTQYINCTSTSTGRSRSSIPCKALMCNGITARTGHKYSAITYTGIGSGFKNITDSYNSYYKGFMRCEYESTGIQDSSLAYGKIFGLWITSDVIIGIASGRRYCLSLYGEDNLRQNLISVKNQNEDLVEEKIYNLNPDNIDIFRGVCEDYNKLFIINISNLY